MATMSPVEPAVKRALMSLLKRGEIDVRQAAAIGCVSRQAVERWVANEGWDIEARRAAFAVRPFARIMNGGRRVPTKDEARRQAEEASDAWEWRRDKSCAIDRLENRGRRRAPAPVCKQST